MQLCSLPGKFGFNMQTTHVNSHTSSVLFLGILAIRVFFALYLDKSCVTLFVETQTWNTYTRFLSVCLARVFTSCLKEYREISRARVSVDNRRRRGVRCRKTVRGYGKTTPKRNAAMYSSLYVLMCTPPDDGPARLITHSWSLTRRYVGVNLSLPRRLP